MRPDLGVASTFCPKCSAPHIVLAKGELGNYIANNGEWYLAHEMHPDTDGDSNPGPQAGTPAL